MDGPDDAGQPGKDCATAAAAGALPSPAGQPPASGFACFDYNPNFPCVFPVPIRSVGCGAFALWELPPPPGCPYAYFLAA